MRHPLSLALPLALALAAAGPLSAPAQAPKAPAAVKAASNGEEEPSVFGENIEVRVVNLEVVVTDRQGQRVRDLKPGDFRLDVDGKTVPIDYFTEVAEGRAVGEATAAAPAAAATAAATPNVEGVDPGADVGTNYVVFIDDVFTVRTHERDQVLQGIVDGLPHLGPSDRMAVVAFGGRRPEMLSTWSRSQSQLKQALEAAMGRPGKGVGIDAQVRGIDAVEALDPNETAPGGPTRDELGLGPRNAGEVNSACMAIHLMENRVQRVVGGVTATMRSLSDVAGRKVMLLVAGGWPRSIGEYVLGTIDPTSSVPGCKMIGPPIYDPIHETANRLGFTLYPVLTPQTPSAIDAEHTEAPDPLGVNSLTRFTEVQETVVHLAERTGGKSFVAGARLDALTKTAEDLRSYYWLGFTPDWKGDDRRHKVKVEVTRPGLEVRNRVGFQDLSRKTEVNNLVESSLMFDQAPGTYPLKIQLGPVPPGGKGQLKVPLKVGIPMQWVTMVQRGRQYVGELELRVALLNGQGDRNEIPIIPVKLKGPEPKPGQISIYETELNVRREVQDVAVSLFDPPSGRVLLARAVFNPDGQPAADKAGGAEGNRRVRTRVIRRQNAGPDSLEVPPGD